jgi:cytochrome b subunit of formate dehydrogenase
MTGVAADIKDEKDTVQNEPDKLVDKVAFRKNGAAGKLWFVRLNRSEIIQHMIFVICFMVLVITGFMVIVPEQVAEIYKRFGENVFLFRSFFHRLASVGMVLVCVYHVYYLAFKPAGRRLLIDMLPRFKDVKDFIDNMRYYLGLKDSMPEFDRFCYKHKLEYGALVAGNVLMSVSGVILWTEYMWSKFVIDIAKVVHGMEAVLACLAIMVWHLYEVHLRPHKFPIDNLWMTGVIDEEEMKEEYMGHYKKIMADPELQDIYIKHKGR